MSRDSWACAKLVANRAKPNRMNSLRILSSIRTSPTWGSTITMIANARRVGKRHLRSVSRGETVEGNCHFLEFPAPKTHAVRRAAELAGQAGEPVQASELSAPGEADSGLAGALGKEAAPQERLFDRGTLRAAKLADAGRTCRRP